MTINVAQNPKAFSPSGETAVDRLPEGHGNKCVAGLPSIPLHANGSSYCEHRRGGTCADVSGHKSELIVANFDLI